MTQSVPKKLNSFSKAMLYTQKIAAGIAAVMEGFYLIFRHQMYKEPNNPKNTRYVQHFCRRMCQVFNVDIQIHGNIPREPALWVSNHISWIDIPVVGSAARVFFLAKAEIENWPVVGKLAKGGGTLFIKRGSGDSVRIREQIAEFLSEDIPVLFFPEATTTDGTKVKKIYGRILGAAIEAKQPIQICLICYVNREGKLDTIAPFVGDISFMDHVKAVLEMPKVIAHIKAFPAIQTEGHTVESITELVQTTMQNGLAELQAEVLKP
ncbi:lysophospholipid acyltransferase family protein [Acinetobacter shaoyimingii]|uniref:1-acyl-sn-glycerol-3-phosphate acyltransferase n=1 Tax=Acinetobacter shaoyimingii TaxID=2715164 RepID=A0A6G8RTA4_9GAMM|nr:lysophospholipid acyltransferase family protein [Acinetobacter shaoyimingii]NHB59273.1 1-acyl-sn-glycerol-3-phosphate acyltransferase [Acinetobacter shaoyimingii]QIO05115.1 1-acyl-sn-glycerol-3-phosphate acyltransferase [Acinetobacter shaoyimingii]